MFRRATAWQQIHHPALWQDLFVNSRGQRLARVPSYPAELASTVYEFVGPLFGKCSIISSSMARSFLWFRCFVRSPWPDSAVYRQKNLIVRMHSPRLRTCCGGVVTVRLLFCILEIFEKQIFLLVCRLVKENQIFVFFIRGFFVRVAFAHATFMSIQLVTCRSRT